MRSDLTFDAEKALTILRIHSHFSLIPLIPENSTETDITAAKIYAMYFGSLQHYVSPQCFRWDGDRIIGIDETYEPGKTPDYPEGYFDAYEHNASTIIEYIRRGWIPAERAEWWETAQRLLATDEGARFVYRRSRNT